MQHKSLNPKKVFLAIIMMMNVIGSELIANENDTIINLEIKLQKVNERIQNAASFHDKMNELSSLKTYVIEAQRKLESATSNIPTQSIFLNWQGCL